MLLRGIRAIGSKAEEPAFSIRVKHADHCCRGHIELYDEIPPANAIIHSKRRDDTALSGLVSRDIERILGIGRPSVDRAGKIHGLGLG